LGAAGTGSRLKIFKLCALFRRKPEFSFSAGVTRLDPGFHPSAGCLNAASQHYINKKIDCCFRLSSQNLQQSQILIGLDGAAPPNAWRKVPDYVKQAKPGRQRIEVFLHSQ